MSHIEVFCVFPLVYIVDKVDGNWMFSSKCVYVLLGVDLLGWASLLVKLRYCRVSEVLELLDVLLIIFVLSVL